MEMKNKRYDFRTAYIDLLINVLTGMVFLFMITTLLIQTQQQKDEGVKKDAQYIMKVVWPKEMNCDVDVWVRDPNKKIVSFQAKDVGMMHIERDDQGWKNDSILGLVLKLNNKDDQLSNEETWVLRGKQPGEYNVNIHLYSCRLDNKQLDLGETISVPVTLTLTQINPRIRDVHTETVVLEKVWQEKTAFNFKLNADNSFDPKIDRDFHDLVQEKKQ